MRRRSNRHWRRVRPRHKNTRAEGLLKGKVVHAEDLERAAAIAEEESKPEADIDVSAEYKKKMVKVFVRRALKKRSNREV